MKKYLKVFSALTIALVVANGTLVFGGAKEYKLYIDKKEVFMDTAPIVKYNVTFVPVSVISKALGATVNWTSPNVTIKKGDLTLVLTVDSNEYTLNGKKYYTQFKPFIDSGRTYVPLRLISNIFGYPVDYKLELTKLDVGYKDTGIINIDTTKSVPYTNKFVDDDSTYTISNNGKYGLKDDPQLKIVYLKNMQTGEFKELYSAYSRFQWYFTKDNLVMLHGEVDVFSTKEYPHFTLYYPETDAYENFANAYYGTYIYDLDALVYEDTEYRSDSTDDSNSNFYMKDIKTKKVTKLTHEKYDELVEMERERVKTK